MVQQGCVRANSSWLLPSSETRSRARSMTKGILSTFCDTEFVRSGKTAQERDVCFDLRWRIVGGEVLVDLGALVDGCNSLSTTFGSGQQEMEVTASDEAQSRRAEQPIVGQEETGLREFAELHLPVLERHNGGQHSK